MKCRHCSADLIHKFVDLGFAPPSNAYLTEDDLNSPEKYYPLKVMVCDKCWLVQTEDFAPADQLFNSEYAYFSSTSTTWLEHAKVYAKKIIYELDLNQSSFVIEIASNDGYLLKNFLEYSIPCIGIEPTASTSNAAEKLGISVIREFFGEKLAQQLVLENKQADLIIGNNVYAHVPDINDFTKGLKTALKPNGTITLEFPHLMRLIEFNQFDTIYHEHFSYFSLTTVEKIFRTFGLRIWKVEELSTHGGSLRIYGCHEESDRLTLNCVKEILINEERRNMQSLETYLNFQSKAENLKNTFLSFLLEKKKSGKKVVGYGAAAKGNTLLNFAGVRSDLIACVYDAANSKQNKFLPGSHIPILSPEKLNETQFDYLIVLPWNIFDEVCSQYEVLGKRGVKFVRAVPDLDIV